MPNPSSQVESLRTRVIDALKTAYYGNPEYKCEPERNGT